VWILDNTPSAYALQPDRGIPIPSFEGDPNDRELSKVAPLLKQLSEKTSVER
jgi:TFIIF-interacting CTD phosphatase-like protein